eukprot:m.459843 g.459843  ORF g.459843 m.459843 type:complete len:222 (+) comp21585_c0_seq7:242-907(+)
MESSPQDRNVAENVTSKEADERVSGTTTNKDAASDKMKTEVKKESKKRKKSNSSSARRRVKKKREEATHITGYALFASTVDQRIMTQSAIEYAWQQKSQSERKMWDQEATRIRQRKLRREKGADAYQWFNPSTMNTSTHLALLSHTLTHTGEELKEKEKVRAQQQEGPIRHDRCVVRTFDIWMDRVTTKYNAQLYTTRSVLRITRSPSVLTILKGCTPFEL